MFDLFGTLTVDQTSTERHRLQEPAAKALGVPLDAFQRVLRSSFTERATGAWGGAAESLRKVARQLGSDPSEDALVAAVALRQSAERQLARPRDGVIDLLVELRTVNVPVGVLSDCTAELAGIWDQLPYAELVDAAVFSVSVGVRKPDPAMYDEVVRCLCVEAERIHYVGDGGSSELSGARRAGMHPVLLRESLDEPAATRELRYDAETDWDGDHVPDIPELRRLLISRGFPLPRYRPASAPHGVSMPTVMDLDFYAAQSGITDPGQFTDRLSELPNDLSSMRSAARQLVYHYRDGGDYPLNGIAPDRVREVDTRYAEDMLARVFELVDQPLTCERAPHQRLVGCCRDYTVFFLAIARQHGWPARVGFATYFEPGWFIDHVIAEVWDADQRRWRLVEPELADGFVDAADGALIDPLDVPPDRFLVGPQAWRSCRAGHVDAQQFVVDPGLQIPDTRGWPYVRRNLIHDLAALSKHEMLLWDDWGLTQTEGDPTQAQLSLLDDLAAITSSSVARPDQIRSLYDREEFRVPAVVTSYSPAHDTPLRVAIRPGESIR